MGQNVIMIDDNEDDLFFTRIVFERSGLDLTLHQFTSAREALSYFERRELEEPALVLLDINMPGMDGFDFLEAYEKLSPNKRQSKVVVMLTSSIDDRDRERALFFASVKAFLSKPIDAGAAAEMIKLLETGQPHCQETD